MLSSFFARSRFSVPVLIYIEPGFVLEKHDLIFLCFICG